MLIAGAGNLGLHTLDQLTTDGMANNIVFFDEKGSLPSLIKDRFLLLSTFEEAQKHFALSDPAFIVTIGQGRVRERLTKRLIECGGELTAVISGKAVFVSNFSPVTPGCIIQPGCAISHNVTFGRSCVLHASALVGHDVTFGDCVTIGSNVNILKGVTIGKYATIGPNVLVYQNIRIGENAYIAPGVIVTKDVGDNETLTL